MKRHRPAVFQFSLRLALTWLALLAGFLTVVRGSDLPSACISMICFGGLLSPWIATFTFLHFQRSRG